MPRKVIWSVIDENVKALVKQLAESKGITLSEYVRQLILRDLDERTVFTTKLKDELQKW